MLIKQVNSKMYLGLDKAARETWERQQFAYLPDENLMCQAGYLEKVVGDYYHQQAAKPLYRITGLSQSGLFLFYCDGQLLNAVVIASDEELLQLLVTHDFPFPQ